MPCQPQMSGIDRALRRPRPPVFALGALAVCTLVLAGIGASRIDRGRATQIVQTLSPAWSRLLGTSNLTAPERIERGINGFAVPREELSETPARTDVAPVMLTRPAAENALVFGDRLKITFFERAWHRLGR